MMRHWVFSFLPEVPLALAVGLFAIVRLDLLTLHVETKAAIGNLASELAGAWAGIRLIAVIVNAQLRKQGYAPLLNQALSIVQDRLARIAPYDASSVLDLTTYAHEFALSLDERRRDLTPSVRRTLHGVMDDLDRFVARAEAFLNAKARAFELERSIEGLEWIPEEEANQRPDEYGDTAVHRYGEWTDILHSNLVLEPVMPHLRRIAESERYTKDSAVLEKDITYMREVVDQFDVDERLPPSLRETINAYLSAVYEAGMMRHALDESVKVLTKRITAARFSLLH